MRTRFEINADKQAAANKWQRADTAKVIHDAANYMTEHERAEAERIGIYFEHKVRGSLGAYYMLYPMDSGARRYYAEQQRYQFPMDHDEQERDNGR